MSFFMELHPVVQALLAGMFTWGMTAFGAAGIFLAKEIDRKVLADIAVHDKAAFAAIAEQAKASLA